MRMSPLCLRICCVPIVAVAAALFLAACGGDDCGSAPTIATPSPPPTSTQTAIVAATATPTPVDTATAQPTGTVVLTIHDELLPSTVDIMGWIAKVVEQGVRRPGYPADVWAEGWIRDQFASFGLEDITLDPVEVKRWTPQQCSLTVWPDAAPQDVPSIPCFALPYSQPEAELETSVALMTPDANVAGKLALVDNNFIQLPQTVIRAFSSREYAPDGEFETGQHPLPFSFAFQNVIEPASAAGAAGFIGIVNAPFDTHDY